MPIDSSDDAAPLRGPKADESNMEPVPRQANEQPSTADSGNGPYIAVAEAGFGEQVQQASNRSWFLAGMAAAAVVVLSIGLWLFAGLTRPSESITSSRVTAAASAAPTVEGQAPLPTASAALAGSAVQPRSDAPVVITIASLPAPAPATTSASASASASEPGPAPAPVQDLGSEPAPTPLEAAPPATLPTASTTSTTSTPRASSPGDHDTAVSSSSTSTAAADSAASSAQAKAAERRRLAAERRREKVKRDNAEREARALAQARARELAALAAQAEKDAASGRVREAPRLRPAAATPAAAPVAAVPAPPTIRGVSEICAGGGSMARSFCLSRECGDPAHAREAVCKQVREAEERRRNPID